MKGKILGLLLVFAFGLSLQAQKLGYVNVKALKSEMPEIARAESEVKLYRSLLFQQGVIMIRELRHEHARVQKLIAGGCLAPTERQKLAINFLIKLNDLELFEVRKEDMIQTFEAKLMEPIWDRIDSAIQTVAVEHQFDYILQEGSPIISYNDHIADATSDVTTLVRQKLGL